MMEFSFLAMLSVEDLQLYKNVLIYKYFQKMCSGL